MGKLFAALILFLAIPSMAMAQNSQIAGGRQGSITIVTPAGGLPVAATTTPSEVASTDASSTITTGGTFQALFAANTARKGCFIQNPVAATETLYIGWPASPTPTTANAASLGAGASFNCIVGGVVIDDAISVEAATTAHAFVAKSQ